MNQGLEIRLLFPIDGYLVYTIDKLVAMVGRQLHFLATGAEGIETMKLYQRYRYERPLSVFNETSRKTTVEEEYARSAETYFNCENCFKVFIIYDKNPVVTIELVDTETGEDNGGENVHPNENETAAEGSSDDDSDQNEETDDEPRRASRPNALKPNGLSAKRGNFAAAGPSTEDTIVVRRRGRLFLRRNARMRKPEVAGEFIVIGGAAPPTSPSCVWEGIVRRNRGRGLAKMERMHYIRKCRAGDMFADERGATWLVKGMLKSTSHHPVYDFLQYNKYMLKSIAGVSRTRASRVS